MKLISKETKEIIAEIITNRSLTKDEAIQLTAEKEYKHDPFEWTDDPDYRINGIDCWYDDLELVSDEWTKENDD